MLGDPYPFLKEADIGTIPICPWAPFLAAACFCLMDSRILSTSFWYRARSLCAPSLASFRACSNDFTRSCVARRRFSSLGSSHLRSALSLTSCQKKKSNILIRLRNQIIDLIISQQGLYEGIKDALTPYSQQWQFLVCDQYWFYIKTHLSTPVQSIFLNRSRWRNTSWLIKVITRNYWTAVLCSKGSVHLKLHLNKLVLGL